jgi:hypothetical protein
MRKCARERYKKNTSKMKMANREHFKKYLSDPEKLEKHRQRARDYYMRNREKIADKRAKKDDLPINS